LQRTPYVLACAEIAASGQNVSSTLCVAEGILDHSNSAGVTNPKQQHALHLV
jgi:hypothetical protein